MKDLIATVGTSIINNFKSVTEGNIKEHIENEFKKKTLNSRLFGAEINIINKLIQSNDSIPNKIYLITTDTKNGKKASNLVKYILKMRLDIPFVEIKVVQELNIKNIFDFEKRGLKNLVNILASIIRENNPSNLTIIPLGGFKAQIFMTGLIAQIFNIKSYYMFEGFEKTIELMPLPITFDYSLFFKNHRFFKRISKEKVLLKSNEDSRLKRYPDLEKLIDTEKINRKKYISLSPIGELFYEKLSFETEIKLPAPTKQKWTKIGIKKNEEHLAESLKDINLKKKLDKINNLPYVKKIIIDYYLPDNKGNQIKIKRSSSNEGAIAKLEYNNNNGLIGAKIYINNKTEEELEAAIIDIREKINL